MNIWHIVFRADSLTYTVGRALLEGGQSLSVWVVDPAFGHRPDDNIQKRLAATRGINLVGRDERRLPRVIDRLIVQMFPRPEECMKDLSILAGRANRITLVTAGDRSRSGRTAIKLQWQEAKAFGLQARKVDRVLYKDGFRRFDLHGLLKRRDVVGFDVHSQFLHVPALFQQVHARDWDPAARRPYLASFLGSQDPAARKNILDSVRHLFQDSEATGLRGGTTKRMYWLEYSDAAPAALVGGEFLDALSQSDFTLCPRGYSLVTHRPMEALLRGTIPVLSVEELDLYGIGLSDGINCVAVPAGRWPAAIERLRGMEESQIIQMRQNILAMLAERVDYAACARAIRLRLGVCGGA